MLKAALSGLVGTVAAALITSAYAERKYGADLAEQARVIDLLRNDSRQLGECKADLDQSAIRQRDLAQSNENVRRELELVNARLDASNHVGRPLELAERISISRSDWLSVALAGRTVTLELDRVTTDGPVVRLGKCQDPPISAGLVVADGDPRFILTTQRPKQRLRLSATCCEQGYLGCPEDTLQELEIALQSYDFAMQTAQLSARFIP